MSKLPSFAQRTAQGLLLKIAAQPKGSTRKIMGLHGDSLKVSLNTPPVDGAANEALLDFLAEEWALGGRDLELVSGHKSRQKQLLLKESGVEKFLEWWKTFSAKG